MKKIRAWFATSSGRKLLNIAYSIGASIVIIGAMCKIIHVRGADYIFITGMIVEAIIFLLSAFDSETEIIVEESSTSRSSLLAESSETLYPSIGDTSARKQATLDAEQNIELFTETLKSLNESSLNLLKVYEDIADAQNMDETLNSVRYINDSLSRIKSHYDGVIRDSYMFKEEMSKLTHNIEALNNVYARLLQAMTSSNLNNNPTSPI